MVNDADGRAGGSHGRPGPPDMEAGRLRTRSKEDSGANLGGFEARILSSLLPRPPARFTASRASQYKRYVPDKCTGSVTSNPALVRLAVCNVQRTANTR